MRRRLEALILATLITGLAFAARYVFSRVSVEAAQNPRASKSRPVRRPGSATASLQTHRNLGKAYYEQGKYPDAIEEFQKVMASSQALATDHLDLGIVLLQGNELDKALGELTTARQMDPKLVAADYNLGILFKRELRYPDAEAALGRVIRADPNEPAAWFNLGNVYFAERKLAEALDAFKRVDDMGFGHGQNFYVASLFHTFTILTRLQQQPEARRYLTVFEKLRDKVPSISLQNPALEGGKYGAILVPAVPAPPPEASIEEIEFADTTAKLGASFKANPKRLENAAESLPASFDPALAVGDYDGNGHPDLYLVDAAGSNRLLRNNGDGSFTDVTEKAGVGGRGGSISAAFADYNNSGHPSLFVAGRGGVTVYKNHGDGTFSDETEKAGLKMPPGILATQALLFDADNDGFLDLVVTTFTDLNAAKGNGPGDSVHTYFFRNNGDGTFTDASESSGLAAARGPMRGALFADFNNHGYADLLLFRDGAAPMLFMNRGEGKFKDHTAEAGAALAGLRATGGAVADFNHDGNFDLALWTPAGYRVLLNRGNAHFQAVQRLPAIAPAGTTYACRGAVVDVNGDGFDDLVVTDPQHQLHLIANRGGRFQELPLKVPWKPFPPEFKASPFVQLVPAWLAAPGRLDLLVLSRGAELAALEKQGMPARWLEVKLDGMKSNTQGVGAVVELKAGNYYHKVFATGVGPLRLYTGSLATLDVVRVTWPNAIVQNSIHVPTDKALSVRESERLASSCPFLYAWDGQRFVFVTDVLGTAPIGELAPDGSRIPPHPEEFVRLPENLRPRNGDYIFQLTDELREVDYFDRLRLVAVDHPATEEVYSNEIYTSSPAEPTLYEIGDKRFPVAATDDRGHDVLALVRDADGRYPADFRQDRILGLAELHSLTLDLGPFRPDARVSLWLKGWVFWTDSNASRALMTNKSLQMVPPYLQVPDAEGRWVTVIPDMGLPSGTNRAMRVDLTGKLVSADHRVRIVTNLCAFWDQAFYTLDDRVIAPSFELSLVAADLHYRGFSTPVTDPHHLRPDSFEYERVMTDAPWNPMSGRYTRYGPVRELVENEDDRLVVMATGDELTARFSAKGLPALRPGWKRTLFLFMAGYAKDGEPNTAYSKTVNPLPFRRMSNYPYGSGAHYPNTETQQRYLERFETRPARALIPPLAPAF